MDNDTGREWLMITLKEENCIYEVCAEWADSDGYGGTAFYSFAAEPIGIVDTEAQIKAN